MSCQRCNDRGQDWEGDSPRCAFPNGEFITGNWNCATMNALRDLCEPVLMIGGKNPDYFFSEDQYLGVLPWDGRFIVLSWYKHRGRTEGAWLIDGSYYEPLRLSDAEEYLEVQGE